MIILKGSSKVIAILLSALILVFLVLDLNQDFESDYLLLILNSVFVGLIPIAVSVFAARTYVQNGIWLALLMSCGMLVFGVGSIIAACARFLPDSSNYTVTTHNLSVFLFSILNLMAATIETPGRRQRYSKHRTLILILSFAGICAFVFIVVWGAIKGVIPEFFAQQGSTQIRNIVLCITVALCFGSSVAFYKQYKHRKLDYLYWYSIALLLIAIGLFAVLIQKVVGSPLGWMGRICQYVGCAYALISMVEIVVLAKKEGVSSSKIMTEFFIDAESNYRILVENISSAIINVNEESKIFFFNTAAKKLFKYKEQDLLNASFLDEMICDPYKERLRNDIELFSTTGKSELAGKALAMEAVDREGRIFPVELLLSISFLSIGYARTYIIQDITERKRQEDRLIAQAEELRKKNRLITDFFTNISHEFKTPLTIILNAIEMTEMRFKNVEFENRDRAFKNFAIMRQNAHRLLRLIANLLDVTKIDAGFLQVNLTNLAIKEWMCKLVESVEDFAALRGIEVKLIDGLELLSMPMDGEMLDRIMLNLLSNSIKHTAKGGHITVLMQEFMDRIIISVTDDGEGIPDDKKDIIFDRFRQVNTSLTRSSEGSGIGLSLSKSLVELLHGNIWFESKLGEGTSFYVELPILEKTKKSTKPQMDGLTLARKVEMEFSDII